MWEHRLVLLFRAHDRLIELALDRHQRKKGEHGSRDRIETIGAAMRTLTQSADGHLRRVASDAGGDGTSSEEVVDGEIPIMRQTSGERILAAGTQVLDSEGVLGTRDIPGVQIQIAEIWPD